MELLRRLCQAFGPSGNEGKIREIIKMKLSHTLMKSPKILG